MNERHPGAAEVALREFEPQRDRGQLLAFFTENHFPFHLIARPAASEVEARLERGAFDSASVCSYWVLADHEAVGFMTVSDTEDPSALVDVRLADGARGRGIGRLAVRALAGAVFPRFSDLARLEATTLVDNIAMQRAFLHAGWVKEAHYRSAGTMPDGRTTDTLGYALLRTDWASGKSQPVAWEIGQSL
ncbi:MAG: GNAT family protein [Dermabacter sp.]|nr:GNAT family protein [Dermabacter sp.]